MTPGKCFSLCCRRNGQRTGKTVRFPRFIKSASFENCSSSSWHCVSGICLEAVSRLRSVFPMFVVPVPARLIQSFCLPAQIN